MSKMRGGFSLLGAGLNDVCRQYSTSLSYGARYGNELNELVTQPQIVTVIQVFSLEGFDDFAPSVHDGTVLQRNGQETTLFIQLVLNKLSL